MTIAPMAGAGGLMIPQQPKPKAGMFGAGKANIGEIISAALNGFLASRGNPVGLAGLQMLHQRRNDMAAQQQAAQDRENQFQDFVRREAYKAAHTPPDVPDVVERIQALNAFKPGLGDTYAQNYANSGGSPFGQLFKDPATGQQYMMGGQGGGLPQVGSVIEDPRKSGGPMPSASGGFPGPY